MQKLVEDFIKYVEKEKLPIEAIALCDKNKLLLTRHFFGSPTRNIYSHTKSFTSLMAGIAIDEGKLSLDTRMVDVLKDEISKEQYEHYFDIRLKHLLMMSSGISHSNLFKEEVRAGKVGPSFLHYVLSIKKKYKGGEKFLYSNGDTHLVARMIEKVYGINLQYLCYLKIFKPLEMSYPIWESDAFGHTHGASNLFMSIEDMNKLGQLFINNGMYKGKRIISSSYIDMCFKKQIDIPPDKDYLKNSGYSFFFWINPFDDSIRADGMYGQFTFIFRKLGYALSIQSPEIGDYDKVTKKLKEYIFDKI